LTGRDARWEEVYPWPSITLEALHRCEIASGSLTASFHTLLFGRSEQKD
jgi:hypothetical protein